MRKDCLTLTLLFTIATVCSYAQKTWEAGFKPTQFVFNDYELNVGFGNRKKMTGLILSYRPSTKDSGVIKSRADAISGGYTIENMYNHLYRAYTIGLYRKIRFDPARNTYLQTELFYRNWSFKDKQAEYNNPQGYRFKGRRTENADVFGARLLFGNTFHIMKSKPTHFYLEVFTGVGLRYKNSVYETRNGFVFDVYYDYKKDIFNEVLPSLHLSVRTGIRGNR